MKSENEKIWCGLGISIEKIQKEFYKGSEKYADYKIQNEMKGGRQKHEM